jgi:hypothetical protein
MTNQDMTGCSMPDQESRLNSGNSKLKTQNSTLQFLLVLAKRSSIVPRPSWVSVHFSLIAHHFPLFLCSLLFTYPIFPANSKLKTQNLKLKFLLIAVFLMSAGSAFADEFKLLPGISLRQEYNDNLFFDRWAKTHDFITTISPKLDLTNKTEKLDLALSGRVDILEYLENSSLNRKDQFYTGSGRYSFTQKLGVSARGSYTSDSRPDRDVLVSGLVYNSARRLTTTYGFGSDYVFTEKTTGFVSYDYAKSDWSSPKFSGYNYEWYGVNGGFSRDMSSLMAGTKAQLNMGYDNTKYLGLEIDTYMASLGVTKKFSEVWSFSVDGGARYLRSDFVATTFQLVPILPPFIYQVVRITQPQTTEKLAWLAHSTLSYAGEKTNGSLTLGRDIYAGSGSLGALERTSAALSVSRRLTWEWSGTFSASYYTNRAKSGAFGTFEINRETVSVSPGIRYEFTRDVFLDVAYSFILARDIFNETEVQRNQVWVRLTVQHPMFE